MRHTSGSFAQVLTSIPALRPLYSSLHSICFTCGLVAVIQEVFDTQHGSATISFVAVSCNDL